MDQGDIVLSDREFARIQQRIFSVAGIALSETKRTLVVSRLFRVLRGLGMPSYDAYLDYLERDGTPSEAQDFVNALTTNLTRFFREEHHFEHLGQHVERLLARPPRHGPDGRPRLRIWSAGCSTGQEPYTIAMILLDAFPELRRWDFRILATDIDTAVIAKAVRGSYPQAELAGLTAQQLRLFVQHGDGPAEVPRAARERVAFRTLNLIDPWPMKGLFDAVFCRNVAIYFNKRTQGEVFSRFRGVLAPDGFLYIGHSENLGTGGVDYRLVGKTIYQPRPAGKARDAA